MEEFFTERRLNTSSATKYFSLDDNEPTVPEGCTILNFTATFVPWNNPNNLISRSVPFTFERILHGILLPILFLVSSPCNLLNIVIFFKHGIKERINLCLFFLSLADFIYVAQASIRYADRIYLELSHKPIRGTWVQFLENNKFTGLFGFYWASSWMTTIIACERCFCVVSPLRSQTVLKTKTMWVIILLSFTVLVGVFFVARDKYHLVCLFNPRNNSTETVLSPNDFYLRNKDVIDAIDAVVYGVIVSQFCIITVTVATIITVVKLRSLGEWREKSSSTASILTNRQVALTRMLIGTSVFYVSTCVPRVVLSFIMLFVKDLSAGGNYFNAYNTFMLTITLFSYINSSLNFFIYYFFGSKFRDTLKTLFHKKAAVSAIH